MRRTHGKVFPRNTPHWLRRIVVLVVPPVEELDLVGPIQVLSAPNRLAGKSIYSVEVVTHGKNLKVDGEGGCSPLLPRHITRL